MRFAKYRQIFSCEFNVHVIKTIKVRNSQKLTEEGKRGKEIKIQFHEKKKFKREKGNDK